MIKSILSFAKRYRYELILTICLFSNLYPTIPSNLYYVFLLGMAFAAWKYKARRVERTGLAIGLTIFILLSSAISGAFDVRAVILSGIFIITLGYSSEEYYQFKVRFMYVSLTAYAFTSVINFYAKHVGVNFYEGVLIDMWGSSTGEFSGYTCHPMWLSAACGIGTIFFFYAMIVLYKRGKKLATYLLGVVSLASIWTAMQGGSRSASGIAVLCCLFLLLNAFDNARQRRKILFPIILVGLMTIPTMVLDNVQFARKTGGIALRDATGQTSRSLLWAARIKEFSSSPIIGVGLGNIKVQPLGNEHSTETGSGWLTALAQTGLVGFLLVCVLIYKAKLPKDSLQTDSVAALMQAVMLFLVLHSIFESYMVQVGWYLCFVFWLLVGILDDYKTYGPVPELENTLFGENENEALRFEDEDENQDEND